MEIIRGTVAAINEEKNILDAIKLIESTGIGFVAIINDQKKLVGVLTDADVRKAILKGMDEEMSVKTIMNSNFVSAKIGINNVGVKNLMKETNRTQIPIINENGILLDVIAKSDLADKVYDNPVVIFAGGLGTRLRPLTNDNPKPMLKIGDKPLLEIVVENLLKSGLYKIFLAINYKGHLIEEHFGNGENWGCEITYIREEKKLGTGGALSLLPRNLDKPFFIMNADLLTKVNFSHILDHHLEHNKIATVCVRQYDLQVPYGVVRTDGHTLVSVDEKPVQSFYVNAGIYLADPEIIHFVPKDKKFDMTDLLNIILDKDKLISVFLIRDYWLDVGHTEDLIKANKDYKDHF